MEQCVEKQEKKKSEVMYILQYLKLLVDTLYVLTLSSNEAACVPQFDLPAVEIWKTSAEFSPA